MVTHIKLSVLEIAIVKGWPMIRTANTTVNFVPIVICPATPLIRQDSQFKVELHPLPENDMFCVLSPNYP